MSPLLSHSSATMLDTWLPTSHKKEKKKTQRKYIYNNNVTDSSLKYPPLQTFQNFSQGSTSNKQQTPNQNINCAQGSVQLPSQTSDYTLKTTEETVPTYFHNFMKIINDQLSQIRQEFSTLSTSVNTDNIQYLPNQIKVPTHSFAPSPSDLQNMQFFWKARKI